MTIYNDLLVLDNKLETHQRHLQFLAIEILKSKNKLNPSFMWKTYSEKKYPIFNEKGCFLLISKR